ncbi:MAG: hypothetical protein WCO06_05290 [Candidatus Roizmanbacteria bacterium]
MLNELVVYFFLISGIILMIVTLIYALKYLLSVKNSETYDSIARKRASHIVRHAHISSQNIIESAVIKAQKILSQAEFSQGLLTEETTATFNSVVAIYKEEMKKELDEQKKTYINIVTDAYKQHVLEEEEFIKKATDEEKVIFEALEKSIKQMDTSHTSEINRLIDLEFEKAKVEIEKYKTEQREKINNASQKEINEFNLLIGSVTADLIKTIVGRSITQEDHSQLIIEALNKAKRDSIL